MNFEERLEVPLVQLRKEVSAATLARQQQVSKRTLYRWRDAFLKAGETGLSGGYAKPTDDLG